MASLSNVSPSFLLKVILTCLLFLVAKSFVNTTPISFDQFELWIAGLIPPMFYLFLESYKNKVSDSKKSIFNHAKLGSGIWSISLLTFVIFTSSALVKYEMYALFEWLNYNYIYFTALSSTFFSIFGALFYLLFAREKPAPRLLFFVAANAVFFAVLLYLI